MTCYQKLGLPNVNHERTHKLIMDLTPNDWKHIKKVKLKLLKNPFKELSAITVKALGK